MGIIQRQSIKGTIYSYLGVGIGFVTTGLLFPKYLSTEQIGLLSLLISYSSLFAIFGNLGFNAVIFRLFPYFRDQGQRHHGFFFLTLIVMITGLVIALLLFQAFKPMIIRDSVEQSRLFVDYVYMVSPLIGFTLLFNTFDAYNRALFNATYGTFLKEVLQRLLIFLAMVLFILQMTGFHHFVYLYVTALCIPGILIFYPLVIRREVNFFIDGKFLGKELRREMLRVNFFGFLIGFSNVIIQRIDTIMINSMIDLSATGVYTISLFFGSLVSMPARSLGRISTAYIADAWKDERLEDIRSVYYKSSLNQVIIGSLLFTGIWGNIHNVYRILPPEYLGGRLVILFFGLSALITMASGISATVLNLSRLYRYQTYFILGFGVLIVGSNFLLIPWLGIVGAALASMLSNFSFQLVRILFIQRRFKIQPFDHKILLVLVFAALAYASNLLMPEISNYLLDILFRSVLISIIFGTLIVVFSVSKEVNDQISAVRAFLFRIFKK